MPILMGIVNVTPDSFSDGGRHATVDAAVEHALALVSAGAGILDIGGESTRPGARPVDVETECERVLPVLSALAARVDVPLSIDTTKVDVARRAIEAGAEIINDVSALRFDPGIADLAGESGVGLVLMHMRGEPRTMQIEPTYDDLFGEIRAHLERAADRALSAGVDRASIVLDPGIGFGKTARDNDALLANLERLQVVGFPLLIGHSRKTFLDPEGTIPPNERIPESIAAGVWAAVAGAHVLRVHDVSEHARALSLVRRLIEARS